MKNTKTIMKKEESDKRMTEKVRIFDIETNQQFALELEGDQVVSFKSVLHQIEKEQIK